MTYHNIVSGVVSVYRKIIGFILLEEIETKEMPYKKELKILHVSTWILFLAAFKYAFVFFLNPNRPIYQSMTMFVASGLYLFNLFVCIRKYRYRIGRVLFVVFYVVLVFLYSNFLFKGEYTELNYFIIPLASILLFNNKWVYYFTFVMSLVLIFIPNYFFEIYPAEFFLRKHSYVFFLGVFSVVLYYRSINTQKEKQLELAYDELKHRKQSELAHLQLKHLRSQMNPHFMFNSLNNIEGLIVDDKKNEAYTYLAHFSNLLRQTLELSDDFFISLTKELSFVTTYLEIEKMRLNNEFVYTIATDGIEDTNAYRVPPMLLQPIIENAIKHGLFHKKYDRKLDIRFSKIDNHIECIVIDNGIGRKKAKEYIESQERLNRSTNNIQTQIERFNDLYHLNLEISYEDLYLDNVPMGTKVKLKLPYLS